MDGALMSERRYTPRGFAVQIEGDDPLRIVVRGELDVATAPQLREGLQAAAERRPQEMVLDASGLDFIDSVGIGLLVAQKSAHFPRDEPSGSLRQVPMSPGSLR